MEEVKIVTESSARSESEELKVNAGANGDNQVHSHLRAPASPSGEQPEANSATEGPGNKNSATEGPGNKNSATVGADNSALARESEGDCCTRETSPANENHGSAMTPRVVGISKEVAGTPAGAADGVSCEVKGEMPMEGNSVEAVSDHLFSGIGRNLMAIWREENPFDPSANMEPVSGEKETDGVNASALSSRVLSASNRSGNGCCVGGESVATCGEAADEDGCQEGRAAMIELQVGAHNFSSGSNERDTVKTLADSVTDGVTSEQHEKQEEVEEGVVVEGRGLDKEVAMDINGGELASEVVLSRESSMDSEHKGEVQQLLSMAEQQRYLRLQHLLKQSNIYSRFLLQRMEDQRLEKDKVEQRRRGRKKKGTTHEGKSPVVPSERLTRSGQQRSPSLSSVQPSKPKPVSSKRGRKRKSTVDSNADFDVSHFMDGQGKLKQMKLSVVQPSSSADRDGLKSNSTKVVKLVDEDIEERYFEGKVVPVNQPRLVSGGIMRSYQLDGMEWLKSLYENGVNGILGDEMGLGKTLQCISFISYLIEQGVKGPFLVAAPLSTIPNWVAEFKKFTPEIPVVLYHGSQQEREDIRRGMFANSHVGKFGKAENEGPKGSGVATKGNRRGSRKTGSGKGVTDHLSGVLPVLVTSYDICMRDQRFLENRKWKFLVVDEGHRIKNLNCKLIRTLKSYDASNRLLLTGTPLQNNLAELWSLLNFLLPNIFNDLDSFQSLFDFDMTSGSDARERIIAQEREQHVLGTLHQILTPFLLRRLKTDVEFSLPPKKEVLVYAPLTGYQEKYYKSLLDRTVFQMMEEERNKKKLGTPKEENLGDKKGRSQRKRKYKNLSDEKFESVIMGDASLEEILTDKEKTVETKSKKTSAVDIKLTSVFVMLRKCVNHPYLLEFPLDDNGDFLVDEQLVVCCGKMMLLDRMLTALLEQGHKVLIFSQFTRMLDVIEDYLDLRGLDRGRLDGSMAFADREEQMTKFKESPECKIFLLSTRAGGLGINLTAADTVIIYDSDWNPQCDLQAQDRCHRIGQTQTVMVYRLVTANTIDQRIVERAASKRRLEKMVIHKGKFKGLSSQCDLSIDDLIDLLHSVDHEKVVNNQAAVISDEALAALLDRTMTSSNQEGSSSSGELQASAAAHYPVNFKVIAERDSRGNLTNAKVDGGVDTVDCLALKGGGEAQGGDSGCEMASSSSSKSSTSPEPMATGGGSLNSNSSSSLFSCDSDAMGPSSKLVTQVTKGE